VSPPKAAKNVRAIFNIVHTEEFVKHSASPLCGSAAKLNGIFQLKDNFWFCLPALPTGKRKFFIIVINFTNV